MTERQYLDYIQDIVESVNDIQSFVSNMDYLEALRDPSHPEHREMVEGGGPSFNPERFDLASIDRRLPQLSRSRRKGYGNIANKPVKL